MKRTLLILLTIFMVSNLKAQEAGDLRFSFVLTPQISWLNSDHQYVDSKGSYLGYNFGVIMDRFFGDNYALCTGLTINTTGGKLGYPPNNSVPAFNQTYKLKYIEVPLGLKLRSEDLHRTNIYGRFGLSNQINIQARDRDNNNISDEVKLFAMGYHLGGGIEYSLGKRNALMIGILYNNGFTDVTKKNYGINDRANLNRFVFEFGFIF